MTSSPIEDHLDPDESQMRRIILIPNYIQHAMGERLDKAIAEAPDPEIALAEREGYADQLLDFFGQHGYVPTFSLAVRSQEEARDA